MPHVNSSSLVSLLVTKSLSPTNKKVLDWTPGIGPGSNPARVEFSGSAGGVSDHA